MVWPFLKLTVEQYLPWLDAEIKKLVRPAVSRGRRFLEEIQRSLDEAKRFFEELSIKGERDVASKRDPVSYRAARAIAHSAKQAATTLGKIQLPGEITWESLRALKDSLSSANRSLRDSRSLASRELSGLYILDMRSFGGFVDRVSRASEKLAQFLEGEGNKLQKARTLEGIVAGVHELRKRVEDQEQERNRLLHASQLITDEVSRLESEREDYSNQSSLREILEIERRLRKESSEFRTITLAHLKRPLRKLGDLSQRGEFPMGPDERAVLDEYIASPYRSFLSKRTGPQIITILQDLEAAMKSGKLGFKQRKAVRIMLQLEQLLSGGSLLEKQTRGRELLSRRRKILQSPGSRELYQARRELLSKLEERRRQRGESLTRLRSLEEVSADLSEKFHELIRTAEARTSEYLGQQVRIEH